MFCEMLPLVSATLEQLCSTQFFFVTNLDLRSVYNLVCIREGDEWKTTFSSTSGHYEYHHAIWALYCLGIPVSDK